MYRILIWGCGLQYGQYINAIKYQEVLGSIKVVGITGRDQVYSCLDGYPFIPLEDIKVESIDYVVVTSEQYYKNISDNAVARGFRRETVIMAKVFCLPYFDFEKYVNLLQSKISIIAINCWGGRAYHALGMQFATPFINMYVRPNDYLKLLNNLSYYLELPLEYCKMQYEPKIGNYPVGCLGDVELYFNHYSNMEEAAGKWNERIKRLNMENLFVMMYTDNYQVAEQFDSLPYDKKVCFVPFESTLQSSCTLQIASRKAMCNTKWWEMVNYTVSGFFHDYNLIDLLLEGRINHDRYYVAP